MAKKEIKEKKEIKQKSRFFKDMKAELKKVIWPTAKQTANNTVAVIAFTLVIALIVFVLDVVFDFANKKGVVALQEKIKSSYSASNNTEQSSEENGSSEENSEQNSNEGESNNAEENATDVNVETEDAEQNSAESNE